LPPHRPLPPEPRRARAVPALLALLVAGASLPALAEGVAAESIAEAPDVVVTATRLPTPLERVPAAVTVIDRRAIAERGHVTLVDALRAVPGAVLVQSGPPGANASLFLRGANSDHVLVLLDGVPVNDPATSKGLFNFGSELLADVERIEIVRGPASGLYGSAAIGGVVNIITRAPGAARPLAGEVELAGGSARTLRGHGHARGTVGPVDYAVTLQSLSTAGWNATPRRLAGNLRERDGLSAQLGSARLRVRLSDAVRIEAMLRARASRFGLDNVPLDDPNFTGENRHVLARLGAEADLLAGAWTTRLVLSQSRHRQRFRNAPDAADPATSRDSFASVRTETIWANEVRLPDLGPARLAALSFGLQHAAEESETRIRSLSIFGPFAQDLDARQESRAAYAGGQARLFDRIDISTGARLDATRGFDDAFTWRLGAAYDWHELGTRLHAAYGTAFKAPSLFDRFGVDSFGFRGNPALRPERSRGFEIGATTRMAAFGRADGVRLALTYWQSRVEDLIQFDFAASTTRNVGRARLRGAEAELALRPHERVELAAAYTFTDARDAVRDARLLRRPEHQLALRARIEPVAGLVIAPELVLVGRFRDVLYSDAGAFLGEGMARGGLLANLAASWRVQEGVTLILEGRNLTDSDFEPANGFASPGRSVILGTRLGF